MLTTDLDLILREQTALTDPAQLFILTDSNTRTHCLPIVLQTLSVPDEHILTLPSGEQHKTLEAIEHIWQWLLRCSATRKSMLINVGGGVITDLGGFAAATYMRGMQWLNIPTTLLGMVDAAAGGKTGFDYQGVKNLIGVIRPAKETIIYTPFLGTLPAQHILSGFAEMLKHALISSPLELNALLAFNLDNYFSRQHPAGSTMLAVPEQEDELHTLISRSIDIKNYIVESDPEETGMRQTLNLGHTIGHALEAYFNQKTPDGLLHGYAVMYGLVAELYLSCMKQAFPEKDLQRVVALMKQYYGKPVCPCKDYAELLGLMQHDKKNTATDRITFTLLHSVGNYRLGCVCTHDEIRQALDFLFNC